MYGSLCLLVALWSQVFLPIMFFFQSDCSLLCLRIFLFLFLSFPVNVFVVLLFVERRNVLYPRDVFIFMRNHNSVAAKLSSICFFIAQVSFSCHRVGRTYHLRANVCIDVLVLLVFLIVLYKTLRNLQVLQQEYSLHISYICYVSYES